MPMVLLICEPRFSNKNIPILIYTYVVQTIIFVFLRLKSINIIAMKKSYIFFVFVLMSITLFSQQVPRQMVVLEIGTGTWCQFCPGASMGASDLLSNGHNVAVVKYHSGDSFTIPASSSRIGYYGISGYPTSIFDGVHTHSGGSTNQSLYPTFLPLYQQRDAIPSSFLIDISGTSSGNDYDITLSLNKVAAYNGTNIVVHLVLTESNIPFSWQGQTQVNQATRMMVPDQFGTVLDFSDGDMQIIGLSFTRNTDWVANNLELVAFIQDNDTKEILQGSKVMLNALPAPLQVDFNASQTTFCAPQLVQFTDLSVGATNWEWNFPGGNPATSSDQNPAVTYSTTGTYDVTLTAWNNERGNIELKSEFMLVNAVPPSPAVPSGPAALCADPGSETYTTPVVAGADSYIWEITPTTAGTLTPNANQCIVNWDPVFVGYAQLKVRGVNDCGNGNWSPNKNITVSIQPGQPGTPTGPDNLCQDPGITEYTSSGTSDVTDFLWEISPASAGALAPMWTMCNVDWNPDFSGTATLIITGINGGCYGDPSEAIEILVNSYPEAYVVTGGGIMCEGDPGLDIGIAGSDNGVIYTLYLDEVSTGQTLAGTGSSVSFGVQDEEGNYTVMAVYDATSCESEMNGEAVISVEEMPGLAAQPDGPVSVYTPTSPESEYTTEGAANATGYEWEFEPSDIGTVDVNGPQVLVTWDVTFMGEVLIKVRGVNLCGEGDFSEELLVMVDNGVGINEPDNRMLASIYPNPAREYVMVNPVSGENIQIKISDLTGRILYTKQVSGIQPLRIELEDLSKGIYMITLTSDEHSQGIRLVIQ
jgi:PKD repeat protein